MPGCQAVGLLVPELLVPQLPGYQVVVAEAGYNCAGFLTIRNNHIAINHMVMAIWLWYSTYCHTIVNWPQATTLPPSLIGFYRLQFLPTVKTITIEIHIA